VIQVNDLAIGGLTKRELFSILLMTGFAASDAAQLPTDEENVTSSNAVADLAVDWADALIEQLNRTENAK
jgi:hypothetical protein